MQILIISEKNITGGKIAAALSGGKAKTTKVKTVPVYEFKDDGHEYAVIGLKGHIIAVDYPSKYNQWFKVKPRELIWAEPVKRVEEKAIAEAIKKLSKDADSVIIATDYDREGELIGAEALEIVRAIKPDIDVKRARYSALTTSEVKRAFSNLSPLDFNLAASAETRQLIDLAWGATLTRFISLASGQVGSDFLSIGRVQSPTLALIVEKEKEIKAFVSKPYWEIDARLSKREEFAAKHEHGRFWESAEATTVNDKIRMATAGKVLSADLTEKRERPPDPFNTTHFLTAATSIGFSAARAMSLAEDLYTNGYISYPRTDNTVYPESLDLREILQRLERTEFGKDAAKVLSQKQIVPSKGKKSTTDHPPIHPGEPVSRGDLDRDHWKIYELVVRRFLATLGGHAISDVMEVGIDIAGEKFKSRGQHLKTPGWREFYPYLHAKENMLPPLAVGDSVDVVGTELLSKETQPPKRYSQGRLIEEMEKLGLGTKSTRHEIINKLYSRGYMRNSPIEPTETAFAVTDALAKLGNQIVKSDMTSRLEREMDEIAEGRKKLDDVVKESRELLDSVVAVMEENKKEIGGSIRKAMDEQNTIGKCNKDGGNLMIRKGRTGKRFLGCSNYPNCTQTYPLPQYGKIVPEGRACEHCQAPVIKLLNKGRRPWIICVNMQCPGRSMPQKPAEASPEPQADGHAAETDSTEEPARAPGPEQGN
ncbi:MAG: DNA topoisomerase I [Euryarchaeota archaeon]|nr:DNA topoisomerase I [Euryarchaeota archaeon]